LLGDAKTKKSGIENPTNEEKKENLNLDGQEIMLFADINADMFSDIITVDSSRKIIIVHIFDPITSNYTQKVSF